MPDTVTKTPAPRRMDGSVDSGFVSAFIVAGFTGVLLGVGATSLYFLAVVDEFPISLDSHPNHPRSLAQEFRLISLETSGYIWSDCLDEARLLDIGDMSVGMYNNSYCGAYGWVIILSMCVAFWVAAWHGGTAVGNYLFDGVDYSDVKANANSKCTDAGFDTAGVPRAANYAELLTTETKVHSKSRMRRETILPPLISEAPRPRPPGLFSDDEENGYLANLGRKRLSPMLRAAAAQSAEADNKSPARRKRGRRRTQAATAEARNELHATSAFAHVPLPCKAFGIANEMPILLITNGDMQCAPVIEPLVESGCFVVHVDGSALSTKTSSSRQGAAKAANACAALVDAILILRHNSGDGVPL